MTRKGRASKRLFRDDDGNGFALECLGALMLVLALAVVIGSIGGNARRRIAGGSLRSNELGATSVVAAPNEVATGSLSDWTRPITSDPSDRPVPNPTSRPSRDDSNECPGCTNGFVNGAMHAFMNGEGELVGDMFGVRDRDIVDWVWNRPTSQVIGDVQLVASGVIAAAPSVIASAGSAAIASHLVERFAVESTTYPSLRSMPATRLGFSVLVRRWARPTRTSGPRMGRTTTSC